MHLYQAIEEESYTVFIDCEICDKRTWMVIEATSFDEFSKAFLKDNKTRLETYVEHATPNQQALFNDGICSDCNKKAKKYEQMILESANKMLLLGSNNEELLKFVANYMPPINPEKPKWPPTT
jgi:hypothetical protein